MALTQSPHLTNIPQAVRIAGSGDLHLDPTLKQQAIDYLSKVRELCEETWQDCFSLYLQGAGAPGPSSVGKDGKEKLDTELRMFCGQVVDEALLRKSSAISADSMQAMYRALVDFVKTEWVEGPCEGGQTYLRNKLAFTVAHLFLNVYPDTIPTFLQPFLALLSPPDTSLSRQNFHPPSLATRLLSEIAQEIHDTTFRSARFWSETRQQRDGMIRDVIRSSGDERSAVDGMLGLAEKGLGVIEGGGNSEKQKWLEMVDLATKTMATWTPWVDLSVSLTPNTLSFYHRLLRQPIVSLRVSAAAVIRTFVAKGIKEPADRLQVLKVLDIVSLLDPHEAQTRDTKDDPDIAAFRTALGGILAVYGSELILVIDDSEIPETLRNEADVMMKSALPLLLRFLGDRQSEVSLSVSNFVSDLLRMYKKLHVSKSAPPTNVSKKNMPPPPTLPAPLPAERRQFLASLLDVSVRQLAWREDAEWEAPSGDEPDPDDEIATFRNKCTMCRSYIESIASIDKCLHTEVVTAIVISTLEALRASGPSAVPWQQGELAMHLVYTFGELNKNNTRAAFYELPDEMGRKAGRDRLHRISVNKLHVDSGMASGRSAPTLTDGMSEDGLAEPIPGVYYGGSKDKIDYDQFPLTPLGHLLTLCLTSNIASYPHPSVTLQYFEAAVRYIEFWKSKPGSVQPMFEAMLDERCFYLFTKFVKECKQELELEVVPPILESMRDVMTIDAKLPEADTPEDDLLLKATTGKTYFQDQLHLFEAAGNLVYLTRNDAARQMSLLEAIAGPIMSGIGSGLERYRKSPEDLQAVLKVHHYLMALGNFAKGFPQASDAQLEDVPYQPPFKQMTEALLQALDVMKTQRVVRDSARFAFSQLVNAIGSTIAELVPQFVSNVVTEFEPSELVDFMTFLGLLMHRLKTNTFETMDMLLLPLLSRIFAILQAPITGTDEANIHRRLKDTYLGFFTALMNANLDGVFITTRNKPEFENVLSALLNLANDCSDVNSQRIAFSFFAKSVIAWGTSADAAAKPSVFADSAISEKSKAVANGTAVATNQHIIAKKDRAAQALPGYENFIYHRLIPACFEVPANPKFSTRGGQPVLYEIAMLLRNTLQARGQEAIDFLVRDLLPRLQCPPNFAEQLLRSLRSEQAKDFRKTFAEFIKTLKS